MRRVVTPAARRPAAGDAGRLGAPRGRWRRSGEMLAEAHRGAAVAGEAIERLRTAKPSVIGTSPAQGFRHLIANTRRTSAGGRRRRGVPPRRASAASVRACAQSASTRCAP